MLTTDHLPLPTDKPMNKIVLITVVSTFALMAGCGPRHPVEARMEPYAEKQFSLASKDLRGRLTIDKPVMTRQNGLLFVEVPIRAASNYNLFIDYRVTFFNDQGQSVYQGPWESKTLQSRVFDRIQFNAPAADAVDFRMDIRYSQ